jgi:hypothetical protein
MADGGEGAAAAGPGAGAPGGAELLQRANRRWSEGPGLPPVADGRPLRGAEFDLSFSTSRLRVRIVEWADGEVGAFAAEIAAPDSAFEGRLRPPGQEEPSFEALEEAAEREGGRRIKLRPGAAPGTLELFLGPFAGGAFTAVEGWAVLGRAPPARAAAISAALDLLDRDIGSESDAESGSELESGSGSDAGPGPAAR